MLHVSYKWEFSLSKIERSDIEKLVMGPGGMRLHMIFMDCLSFAFNKIYVLDDNIVHRPVYIETL